MSNKKTLLLGNNLRNIRLHCGLTQYDISYYINRDQMHISGYETNYAGINLHELACYSALCTIKIADIIKNNFKVASLNKNAPEIKKHSQERKQKLGNAIFDARISSNMTIKQACKKLNIREKTLVQYEQGVVLPSLIKMLEICKLYQKDIDELMYSYINNVAFVNNAIRAKIVNIIHNNKRLKKKDLMLCINQFLLKELNYYKNPTQVLNDMQPELAKIIKEEIHK